MKELVKELMESPTCSKELKESCKDYLDALDSDKEQEMFDSLINRINEDINTIDDTINFMSSDKALNMLGEETRNMLLEKSLKAKENGAKYCDCPACSIAAKILEYNK